MADGHCVQWSNTYRGIARTEEVCRDVAIYYSDVYAVLC